MAIVSKCSALGIDAPLFLQEEHGRLWVMPDHFPEAADTVIPFAALNELKSIETINPEKIESESRGGVLSIIMASVIGALVDGPPGDTVLDGALLGALVGWVYTRWKRKSYVPAVVKLNFNDLSSITVEAGRSELAKLEAFKNGSLHLQMGQQAGIQSERVPESFYKNWKFQKAFHFVFLHVGMIIIMLTGPSIIGSVFPADSEKTRFESMLLSGLSIAPYLAIIPLIMIIVFFVGDRVQRKPKTKEDAAK